MDGTRLPMERPEALTTESNLTVSQLTRSRSGRSVERTLWSWICVVALACMLGAGTVGAGGFAPLTSVDLAGLDPVNSNPYGIAFHPTEPWGYVALAGLPAFMDPQLSNGSTIVEFDLATGASLRAFAVGLFPTDLVVTSDGAQLFVTNSTDGTLSRVDLVTETVQTLVLTDSGGGTVGFPTSLQLSPDESQIWVTSNGGDFDGSNENLIIVDRATFTVARREIVLGSLSRIAVLSDGRVVVPVGFPGNDFSAPPEVRIYDGTTVPWTLLGNFSLVVDTSAFPGPVDVVVNPDETRAYVTVFEGSSELFVIDLNVPSLLPPIALPTVDNVQHGLAMTPDGESIIMTDFFADQARLVSATTGLVTDTLTTGSGPNEVGVRGGRLWITNQGGLSVSVFALPGSYIRGDANLDQAINIADGIAILNAVFDGAVLDCEKSADVNDDGNIDISDGVSVFGFLFSFQPAPGYPFPEPGVDLTPDTLSCSL